MYLSSQGGGNHDFVEERHRHRYEVNPEHVGQLEEAGMMFVGHSTDNTRMEIMELQGKLCTVDCKICVKNTSCGEFSYK